MISRLRTLLGLALLAAPAWAHFPFLVPSPDHASVRIFLSETLEVDERIPAEMMLAGSYGARLADGSLHALRPGLGEDGVVAALTGELATANLLYGTLDLGFTQRGEGTPHVLVYYAKTVLGDAFDATAHVDGVPVELTPVRGEGGVRLLFTVDGRPEAGAEMVVILPDGTEKDVVTDADGHTEVMRDAGRYGAWARH